MTEVETARRVRVTLSRVLACPLSRLADDCDAHLVDARTALEGEFGIRLSDAEVAFAKTVGTTIDLVRTKLENKAGLR